MIDWKDVARAATLAALFAGNAAAQPPGGRPGGPGFGPPPFGPAFEPRVQGLPYRAEAVVEFVGGGEADNVKARQTTLVVARDAAGRTHREEARGPDGNRLIAIDDPVAAVRYVLFPERAEGRKITGPRREGRRGPKGERFGGPRGAEGAPEKPARTTESLGKQVIAGLEAEGTRETIQLPAGIRGSASPVEIVIERWYSPELKAVVRQVHRDPHGERTWTLTGITRGEPEASLFEVPAGFDIEEGLR
jgi:hypothetical protein